MDDFFDLLRKIKTYAAYPVIFTSVALIISHLLMLFGFSEFEYLSTNLQSAAAVIFGAALSAVTVYYSCRSFRKSLAAVCAFLCGDLTLFSSTQAHYSLAFCIALAVMFWLVFSNTELFYGFIACILISSLCAVVFSVTYDNYTELLKSFSQRISGRGAAFGAIQNVFNLLFGSGFENMFYYKAFSASTIIDSHLVTGALDIFNTSKTPQPSTAEFLTGRYFAVLFIPLGILLAVFNRLEKETLFAFMFSFALSFFFGDERLFYLMLFAVSPLLYVGSVILIFIAFFMCRIIDIRTGFNLFPNILSLFRNMDKPVYFFIIGAVIALLSYFLCRLIAAKFGLLEKNEMPRSVKRLVSTLGGSRNILKIENGSVIVANPNLIDVLRLDCDIRENVITLLPDDIDVLRKYVL